MSGTIEGFPLSPRQRELWLWGRQSGYRREALCRLRPAPGLESAAVEAALRRAVERHEILRTNFRSVAGMDLPLQVIDPRPRLDFATSARLESSGPPPWEPAEDPPLAARWVEGGDAPWLWLALPALCADATTLGLLAAEVGADLATDGGARPVEPMQYADFADWAWEILEAEEASPGREYWRTETEGPKPAAAGFELPVTGTAAAGAAARARLDSRVVERIGELAGELPDTVPTFLLTAWHVLLGRVGGSRRTALRVVTEGRRYDEVAGALGPYARSLPLAAHRRRGEPFAELWRRLQDRFAEAVRWQDYSAGTVADDGTPEPRPAFSFCYLPPPAPQGGTLAVTWRRAPAAGDVVLQCAAAAGGVELELRSAAGGPAACDLEILAGRLARLVSAAAADPRCAADRLPLLSAGERHYLLVELAQGAPPPAPRGVDALVSAQAARTPDRVAVEEGGRRWTYRRIEERAAALARELRRHGVGAESLVALDVERSAGLVAAILGTWKTGAAYLPLDPSQPEARLAAMMEEARPVVVVRRGDGPAAAPTAADLEVVYLDRLEGEPGDGGPAAGGGPVDRLAYVLYTSGSTGRPKGVAVTHRSLANYLLWCRGHGTAGRSLVHSPVGFDLTVTCLLAPLVDGGRVLPMAGAGGVAELAAALGGDGDFGLVKLTPSHLDALATLLGDHGDAGASVEHLFVGGEALFAEPLEALGRRLRVERFVNEYGPTEATVGCCAWTAAEAGEGAVPIGRPIDGARLYVLDDALEPVPGGVTGELHIGGAVLARGYLGRPAETAARFLPDPFCGEAGGRMYRSGDLVHHLPGGDLVYRGRGDDQLKIRGHRIEPGEVRACLLAHPRVRDAAVVARPGEDGRDLLAAYLVAAGAAPTTEELRAFLGESLPESMIPHAFAVLDALPLSRHGKLDRERLPALREGGVGTAAPYEAPRGDLERRLARLWERVLGRQRVGRGDDFFALGGDSILSIQIVSGAREEGIALRPRDLFSHRTVAELARVARSSAEATPPPVPELPVADPALLRGLATELGEELEAEDAYPLSPLQQGLLFHSLDAKVSGTYMPQLGCTLRGPLDLDAFRRSWQDLLRRHPALRTAFVWESVEAPLQVVCREVELPFVHEDWSELPEEARRRRWRRLRAADLERPFDLRRPPLTRLHLIRLGAEEHRLLWTHHHLILDGWSVELLVADLLRLYAAHSAGAEPEREEAPAYRDYVAWLAGRDLAAAEEFWRRTLAGCTAPTPVGAPAGPTLLGGDEGFGELSLRLPRRLTTELQELAAGWGVTPATLVHGLWALLLSRYSGESDVLFGTVTSGRPAELPGAREMIGLFINTLPLRLEVEGGAELVAWLRRLQELHGAAREWEFSPLLDIQGWSPVPRGVPLFESLVIFENYPVAEAVEGRGAPRLEVADADFVQRTNYALTLFAAPRRQLLFTLLFERSRFGAAAARRVLGHLGSLCRRLAADGGRLRLGELEVLSEAERHQLLHGWNDTRRPYPELPLYRCFEERAGRAPDAVALVDGDLHLSRGRLDRRASQWARRLAALGIGSGDRVAVHTGRGAAMVTALLAVHKAGAAYVPLDPDYPAQRIAFMLDDSAPAAVLTESALAGALHDGPAPRLLLDREPSEELAAGEPSAGKPSAGRPAGAGVDDLAYVIYTSGSTGRPKGVEVTHRGLINFLTSMARTPGLGGDDVLLAVTSLSFDIAALELFLPLLVGARLVLAGAPTASDGGALAAALDRHAVTVLQATPSTWRLLVEGGWRGADHLRVLSGGEALPADLAPRLAELGGELWNLYGPTETTIWSTVQRLAGEERPIPVGRPIANTTVHLLDRRLRPVPSGIAGELYLGGDGVARGYLGRPALTADRFVPDPFEGVAGARMYRTGDLARWRYDGSLEFLGRLDHQVKVRGHRIELGEIEAVLAAHPAVRQAVATVREEGTGDQRLVAYVVPRDDSLPRGELLGRLRDRLPPYMVPASVERIDEVPLTPNGKVDRSRLPAPRAGAADRPRHDRPRGTTQEMVAAVWEEVFGRSDVGPDDDFLALGGHSLLATRIVSRLRSLFDVDLPLHAIFEASTLGAFAQRVDTAVRRQRGLSAPPLEAGLARALEEPPLSFAQQRLWFLSHLRGASAAFNLPAALRVTGELDADALGAALTEIERRHQVLRTTLPTVRGMPKLRLAGPGRRVLARVDLTSLPAERREEVVLRLAGAEARRPFDLGSGPLWRATLVHLAAADAAVLLTLHHVVGDAWSIGVLVREVSALYEAIAAGRPSPLPELPVQYADFAVWQRRWLQGEVLRRQLDHWRNHLSDAPPACGFPADRPAPEAGGFRGVTRPVEWSDGPGPAVRRLARSRSATPFMVLLAALKVLLRHETGRDDVVVGTDVANRNRLELEPLIGFFVNQLVLRTDLSGDPTFDTLLERVRRVTLDAQAHQDLPFDRLVEGVRPGETDGRAPLFRVKFFYDNTPAAELDPADLRFVPLPIDSGAANLDFTLALADGPQGSLAGRVTYSTDLYDPSTVDRVLWLLRRLVERVTEAPGERLSDLDRFLDDADRRHRTSEAARRRVARLESFKQVDPRAFAVPGGGTDDRVEEER